jgi:hypothetical protein
MRVQIGLTRGLISPTWTGFPDSDYRSTPISVAGRYAADQRAVPNDDRRKVSGMFNFVKRFRRDGFLNLRPSGAAQEDPYNVRSCAS